MATHYLKTVFPYFELVARGLKPFELRKNDRNYKEADTLVLREWCPEEVTRDGGCPVHINQVRVPGPGVCGFTGRAAVRRVGYVMEDFEGLAPGYVAMTIEPHVGDFVLPESGR